MTKLNLYLNGKTTRLYLTLKKASNKSKRGGVFWWFPNRVISTRIFGNFFFYPSAAVYLKIPSLKIKFNDENLFLKISNWKTLRNDEYAKKKMRHHIGKF